VKIFELSRKKGGILDNRLISLKRIVKNKARDTYIEAGMNLRKVTTLQETL